jgi:GntR family transcriptional repressor for pyruvate dehydrogenase complex
MKMSDDQNTAIQRDLFQTVRRTTTLANRVTNQIEQLMMDGRLQPGDRLPPERELARQFGVSRTVVREAVRALAAKSLLEVEPGSGTTVRSPTPKSVAQSMTMLLRATRTEIDYDKVHEVRRILEVEIAGLAAERRTDEDLKEMEEILRQTAEAEIQDDRESFPECDVAFHAALACATHNELFSLLLDSMADIMIKVRQLGFEVPDMPMRALRHHCAIFERVKAGDPKGARRAMREHLIEAEDTMRQALSFHVSQSRDEGDQWGES